MVVFAQRLRDWRVRRLRQHTIAIGLHETGLRAVRQFRSENDPVVAVTSDPFAPAAEDALRAGAYVVGGSGTDPEALQAAGIANARRIVCAEGDDLANVVIVLGAAELRYRLSPHGDSIEMLVEADERSDVASLLGDRVDAGEVTLFNLNTVWAWRLLAAGPLWRLSAASADPPSIVIMGGGK